jgi:hypothetical protein
MKREDLQQGQIVKFKKGNLGIMVGSTALTLNGGVSTDLMNAECISKGSFPATQVYNIRPDAKLNADIAYFLDFPEHRILDYCKLVWEAPAPIEEMTLEQVCKELGRDIKIVRTL